MANRLVNKRTVNSNGEANKEDNRGSPRAFALDTIKVW